MTFSFWLRKQTLPSSGTFQRIFEFSDNSGAQAFENNSIALDISSSGIILPVITGVGGNSATSCFASLSRPIVNYNVCDNNWNHIDWVINGSSSVIYVNGSNTQLDTITNLIPGSSRVSASIGSSNFTGRDFSGNIDDFRYYKDKVLNEAEIYQLNTNNFYTLDISGGFLANGSSVIYEPIGSKATANSGTLTLLHGDASGCSSILFRSKNNGTSDYAYIQYQENFNTANFLAANPAESGLLTIGIENDSGNGTSSDRISLWSGNGNGRVGVNTKNPQQALDVSGQVQALSFNATSDYRAKDEVVPLNNSFTVDSLNPVTYRFKATGKQDIGFIAHEVQELYPFLVSGEKDGPYNQSLNYNGFIGILTKEIQDLKKKVSDQETKALDQEARALAQDARIQALEKMVFNK
jgi:hypothetical protein